MQTIVKRYRINIPVTEIQEVVTTTDINGDESVNSSVIAAFYGDENHLAAVQYAYTLSGAKTPRP